MNELFKNYLFTKHILVSDVQQPDVHKLLGTAFNVLVTLGQKFGIRIKKNPELATLQMVHDAEENLGMYVPEPFYRGFPDTVRELTPEKLLFDQLLHYAHTYGCDWWDEPGHSVMEELHPKPRMEAFEKVAYNEQIDPKDFDILPEKEAETVLKEYLTELMASNRPLNQDQIAVAKEGLKCFGPWIIPDWMPCKDTVIRMLYDFKDVSFCKFLVLSDTIKLLNYIQWNQYHSENLKKLNLRNQDRKLIAKVIDWFFTSSVAEKNWSRYIDDATCHEKRKIWCGLLHHIHYQAKTEKAKEFVAGIRNGKNQSCLAIFEGFMDEGNPVAAAKYLAGAKGKSALLRNMNYILSRCYNDEMIEEVFKIKVFKINPVILIQLMMQYHNDICFRKDTDVWRGRTFVFNRNNRMRVHPETLEEIEHRKSQLKPGQIQAAEKSIRRLLEKTLKKKDIGRVWIDPSMEQIAVPLAMSTGNNGYGILPAGSKVHIPEGKFVRAFTYWEKVNDIDLSAFAVTTDGRQEEFSWRNMYHKNDESIVYSGDQTSGYNGGSEYFDISIEAFRREHPNYRYLVFCNNVYSGINFDQCTCKAGFMVRDEYQTSGWAGERRVHDRWWEESAKKRYTPGIFDPRTVKTSFRINAESMLAYLFAIDLENRNMIWLNMARSDNTRVAGTTSMDFLLRYFTVTDVLNVADLFRMAGTEVENPEEAHIVVSDMEFTSNVPDQELAFEQIHSWDFEKILGLLQPA